LEHSLALWTSGNKDKGEEEEEKKKNKKEKKKRREVLVDGRDTRKAIP
jgi:hypothetical protein